MSDEKKGIVVGLDRKPINTNELDKIEPNVELVAILEQMLEGANRGYLQEMVAVAYNKDGTYANALVVDVSEYDPSFLGHIDEVKYSYRELCYEYQMFEEE